MQLWHVGRMSHSSIHPEEGVPIAPSAIVSTSQTYNSDLVKVPCETPRVMTISDIKLVVEQYRQAAANAREAGFDGVEIHSANGYLIDQFLQDGTNVRDDAYGGSIENRSRFLMEVVDAVCTVFPPDRVGVRLSPLGTFNAMKDSNPIEHFSFVISALNTRQIGYLHLIEPRVVGGLEEWCHDAINILPIFRPLFKGILITAGGYTRDSAEQVIASGLADAVAFGRLFIANPDLPERFARNAPLNPYQRPTFYTPGPEGYTDYPFLEGSPATPAPKEEL